MDDFILYCIDAGIEMACRCSERIERLQDGGTAFSEIENAIRERAYALANDYAMRRMNGEDAIWDFVAEEHYPLLDSELDRMEKRCCKH